MRASQVVSITSGVPLKRTRDSNGWARYSFNSDATSDTASTVASSSTEQRRPLWMEAAARRPPHQQHATVLVDDESSSPASCGEDDDFEGLQTSCSTPGRRLWDGRQVYPNGVQNWRDAKNCEAAAQYDCPCGERCLSRMGVIEIYEHRKELRKLVGRNGQGGNMRDVIRERLETHYDRSLGVMQNSFVVAGCGGICERAFAVASGISETTFARARADVTKVRPLHSGRQQVRERRVSHARVMLDAWVRAQRHSMEGDKNSGEKWYTERTNEKQLWSRYVRCCDLSQQPTVGTSRLLFDIWKEHKEIVMVKPTGHAICETCSDIHAERLSLEGLDDREASARRTELDAEAEAHAEFHSRERQYYDDAVCTATYRPHRTTCVTIDAPTAHQFDLPHQARARRDTSKKLDGTHRWQSKVEGVLDAGVGMLAYIAHAALGGGPNLVCTVLLLTLFHHVAVGRPLGSRLHVQLDNTTAENKNVTLIGVVGLLVAWGWFEEATIFYLPVGHTYNELDAAFGPLINTLLRSVVPTIQALLDFISATLAIKRVRVVRRLHHLWDFTRMLGECMHPLGGFARTQQSSGMHEFHISKDSESRVQLHSRQSSQSSTWNPEGPGELLFRSVPSEFDCPPIAPVKASSEWRREEVQCNVRRWLPHLGLHTEQLQSAEREWESDFQMLCDDANSLPDHVKLAWRQLPKTQTSHTPRGTTAASLRDMVENPPVNPVYGHRRRQSAVSSELVEWQNERRTAAEELGVCTPMFQSDYLIVCIKGNVMLARVCCAPSGGAMQENDVVDLLEYQQTPHPDGVGGLFGTFMAKKNSEHDPRNKASRAYVRHRDVNRSSVLVYNVSTFGSAQAIQISTCSLRLLACVRPEAFAMPDELPESHSELESGARGGAASRQRRAPVVEVGTRIAVHWTEEPEGWFKGRVTSNRRDDHDAVVSRVLYDSVDGWREHAKWHHLDPIVMMMR